MEISFQKIESVGVKHLVLGIMIKLVARKVKTSSFAGMFRVINLQSSVKITNCNKYDAAF